MARRSDDENQTGSPTSSLDYCRLGAGEPWSGREAGREPREAGQQMWVRDAVVVRLGML